MYVSERFIQRISVNNVIRSFKEKFPAGTIAEIQEDREENSLYKQSGILFRIEVPLKEHQALADWIAGVNPAPTRIPH